MKWKKEHNIRSLNDPAVKLDSSQENPLHHHSHHNNDSLDHHKYGSIKTKIEHDNSFKSDDED